MQKSSAHLPFAVYLNKSTAFLVEKILYDSKSPSVCLFEMFKRKVTTSFFWKIYIQLVSPMTMCVSCIIPQGTVVNNLGPNRLADPKALDPHHYRQPTLWLPDLCLGVLTMHGTELRLFGAKTFPLLILLMSHIWHSSRRYNF